MKKIFLFALVLAPLAALAHAPNFPQSAPQFTLPEAQFEKHNVKWTLECTANIGGQEKTVTVREYYANTQYSGQFPRHKRLPGEVRAQWFEDRIRSNAQNQVANITFEGTGAVARITLPKGEIGSQMNGKIKLSLNRNPYSRKNFLEEYSEADCRITDGPALAKR